MHQYVPPTVKDFQFFKKHNRNAIIPFNIINCNFLIF